VGDGVTRGHRRAREVERAAADIRPGDAMLSPRTGQYARVLAVASEHTLTRTHDAIGRLRWLRVPTRRFTLADGTVDWERTTNVCDVLELTS
jgi:hypothetical protein